MLLRSAIASWYWPKRHVHVVEECRVLSVRDALDALSPRGRVLLSQRHPAGLPPPTVIARNVGVLRRWYLKCPTCAARCETLFVPPAVTGDHWRCRRCWNLIYASQRYGRRHPLRQVLTHRKQAGRARRLAKLQRQAERQQARARGQEVAMKARRPITSRHFTANAYQDREDRTVLGARQEAYLRRQRLLQMLEEDAPRNQEYLDAIKRGELSPRSVQAQAARILDRARRRLASR